MPCQDCNPAPPVSNFPLPTGPCTQAGDQCCDNPVYAACVEYDSTPLTCLQGNETEKLDVILQRIDVKICELSGGSDPYNDYSLACLEPVTTQKEFAEKAATILCQLRTTVLNFINNIYPVDLTSVRAEINALNKAGFDHSCSELQITASDTLSVALSKITNAICDLNESITDLTSVDWNRCTTSSSTPSTIQDGFNFIVQQLCAINSNSGAGGGGQITFDNTGTCLSSPTAQDSLHDTVVKIRTRLCSLPTFSVNALSSSCVNLSGTTTLEQTLSKILEQIDILSKTAIRQADTTQFQVTDADPTQPCLGKKINMVGTIGNASDRLVASSSTDSAPGTLDEKIQEGAGIIIDSTTNPQKLTVSADPAMIYQVKAKPSDNEPGFLGNKISGSPGDVSVNASVDATNRVVIAANLNYDQIITRILDIIETDSDFKSRLCTLVATCPSPCSAPTNVQAVQVS